MIQPILEDSARVQAGEGSERDDESSELREALKKKTERVSLVFSSEPEKSEPADFVQLPSELFDVSERTLTSVPCLNFLCI